jgi:hypothetical protein
MIDGHVESNFKRGKPTLITPRVEHPERQEEE